MVESRGTLRAGSNDRRASRRHLSPNLRDRIVDALERTGGSESPDRAPESAGNDRAGTAQDHNQLLVGSELPADAIPAEGAGFGSTVFVWDIERHTRESFTLMTGPLLDIDADHVSLASPIGRALLGVKAGDMVFVETPQRRRQLYVLAVRTLQQRLEEHVPQRPFEEESG